MEPVDDTEAAQVAPTGDVDAGTDDLYPAEDTGLRAVHDAVVMLAEGLGEDTHRVASAPVDGLVEPWVRVARTTEFATVGPGPDGTVRVGLAFADEVPPDERLSPAGGFGAATHCLDLPADCDEDDIRALEPLLEAAYLQNG
ncbi:hypothetical protein RKE38_18730 [Phycicoccus sp. M110.8]|uniref:hypothetical protein n=1 Tax=Phycicoccus sp. M110.8 TaxID=3075433 RepID=UPI0028FDB908|nr:hypothetical protein [Phycicoccus sp. M110.8]MDU0315740.1 hypothetical protein [Phycicoccus sp. M110.8]